MKIATTLEEFLFEGINDGKEDPMDVLRRLKNDMIAKGDNSITPPDPSKRTLRLRDGKVKQYDAPIEKKEMTIQNYNADEDPYYDKSPLTQEQPAPYNRMQNRYNRGRYTPEAKQYYDATYGTELKGLSILRDNLVNEYIGKESQNMDNLAERRQLIKVDSDIKNLIKQMYRDEKLINFNAFKDDLPDSLKDNRLNLYNPDYNDFDISINNLTNI